MQQAGIEQPDLMSLRQVDWDVWDGPLSQEPKVLNPTWKDVETAIQRLDANRYTMTYLLADEGLQLLIGGGNGQFVMTVILDEDRHLTAKDENKPIGKIELTVGGQTGIYDSQIVWDLQTTLECARLFWQDNTLHPSVTWSAESKGV